MWKTCVKRNALLYCLLDGIFPGVNFPSRVSVSIYTPRFAKTATITFVRNLPRSGPLRFWSMFHFTPAYPILHRTRSSSLVRQWPLCVFGEKMTVRNAVCRLRIFVYFFFSLYFYENAAHCDRNIAVRSCRPMRGNDRKCVLRTRSTPCIVLHDILLRRIIQIRTMRDENDRPGRFRAERK